MGTDISSKASVREKYTAQTNDRSGALAMFGVEVTIDSSVAKYGSAVRRASDSSTRLQRLLVAALKRWFLT